MGQVGSIHDWRKKQGTAEEIHPFHLFDRSYPPKMKGPVAFEQCKTGGKDALGNGHSKTDMLLTDRTVKVHHGEVQERAVSTSNLRRQRQAPVTASCGEGAYLASEDLETPQGDLGSTLRLVVERRVEQHAWGRSALGGFLHYGIPKRQVSLRPARHRLAKESHLIRPNCDSVLDKRCWPIAHQR
jgi:hypothetical protein